VVVDQVNELRKRHLLLTREFRVDLLRAVERLRLTLFQQDLSVADLLQTVAPKPHLVIGLVSQADHAGWQTPAT
jgi:hypothetical protein